MQQIEVADYVNGRPDYVNEQPRREQKNRGNANQTAERRLCQLLFLGCGVLCIIQAILNVSLRLTLYSSKESTHSDCNPTDVMDQIQVKEVEKDCRRDNRLQRRFDALTRVKNLLENRNSELTSMIKRVEMERDGLALKLQELSGCASSPQYPANWTEINSRCYFLSTEKKTWEDSRKYCQRQDADLVVINDEQEQRSLYRMDGDADLLFWIGLYDTTGTTGWKWVDGSALTKPFWQSEQPDRGPTKVEDCVEMYHLNPALASWNDAPCRVERRWLCERDQCPRL